MNLSPSEPDLPNIFYAWQMYMAWRVDAEDDKPDTWSVGIFYIRNISRDRTSCEVTVQIKLLATPEKPTPEQVTTRLIRQRLSILQSAISSEEMLKMSVLIECDSEINQLEIETFASSLFNEPDLEEEHCSASWNLLEEEPHKYEERDAER